MAINMDFWSSVEKKLVVHQDMPARLAILIKIMFKEGHQSKWELF